MRLKNLLSGFLTFLTLLFGVSCSNDDGDSETPDGSGRVNITAKATYSGSTSRSSFARNENVVLTQFLVNIEEIEFEIDDDLWDNDDDDAWDDDGYYDFDDDIELVGPFELDLLSGEVTLTNVIIPNGVYEEIEFEFDYSENASSELYEKTILIKGTIDGVPFEFWHRFEEEVEVDFEDSEENIVVNDNNNTIVITFDLNMVLNDIDLSAAVDGNADGLIEISPNDEDGNNALANSLKNKIKEYTDLLDD
ncbi:hypothetical protein [Ascidiimonas aurantiaca]|uniref:hypothetical protein n=1 Tax=Ascidiimonas aurantiaca TaxID=1685432 RepID=UPI0030EBABFD